MSDNILLEMIQGLPEVQVYMQVEGARKNTDKLCKDSPGISNDETMIKLRQNILECIGSLTQFGLSNPLTAEGQPSEEYWAWQRWWRKYLGRLPKKKFQELMLAIKFKEDVSSWRPKGSWKEGY